MSLPVRLAVLSGQPNRGLIDADGRLIADFNADCAEDLELPDDYAQNARAVAALIALAPRIEKVLRGALALRAIECCLMDGSSSGDRRAAREEVSAIESKIRQTLRSLEKILQTGERKETAR